VREEPGLDVSLDEPVLLSDTIDPRGSRHVVNVTFRVTVLGGELRPSLDSRVEGTELVDPERLAALDLRPPMAEAIVRVLDAGARGPAHYLGPLFTDGR